MSKNGEFIDLGNGVQVVKFETGFVFVAPCAVFTDADTDAKLTFEELEGYEFWLKDLKIKHGNLFSCTVGKEVEYETDSSCTTVTDLESQ